MSYLYITALLNFEISEKLSDPIEIDKNLYVTNNPDHFIKKIKPEQALSIGGLETQYLFHGNSVVFSERNTKSIEESHSEIVNFMRDTLAFLHSLWLHHDNSVNVELGFAISSDGKHVHSNSLQYHYWSSEGKKLTWKISKPELEGICKKYKGKLSGMGVEIQPKFTMQQKGIGRMNIAINFLQQARSSADLGLKIANYCSFFESILSTTNVELSHQMAERAAFYLCTTPEERLEHYKLSKKAYSIRSKIVHGDILSASSLNSLVLVAQHCDISARKLINMYFEDSEFSAALCSLNSEVTDSFFTNKIFGIKTNA